MGQQQLLLLVLALVIVAIAISVGIYLFNSAAATSNLEALSGDLMHLASRAHKYHVTPKGLGGGGNSFAGLTINNLTQKPTNGNGTYRVISVTNSKVVLEGVGTRDGDGDGTKCTVQASVFVDSIHVVYINR